MKKVVDGDQHHGEEAVKLAEDSGSLVTPLECQNQASPPSLAVSHVQWFPGPGSGGPSALTKRPTLLPYSPPDGSSYPLRQNIPLHHGLISPVL